MADIVSCLSSRSLALGFQGLQRTWVAKTDLTRFSRPGGVVRPRGTLRSDSGSFRFALGVNVLRWLGRLRAIVLRMQANPDTAGHALDALDRRVAPTPS